MAREFLEGQEFTHVRYTELPDWGHAYTYSINETLVLPWFEQLPRPAARGGLSGTLIGLRERACSGLFSGWTG